MNIDLNDTTPREQIIHALKLKLHEDGRFRADFSETLGLQRRAAIRVDRVRLTQKKAYCGQHAGPCDLGAPGNARKKYSHYLEWWDWIEWNNLVNDVLDDLGVDADVWSLPHGMDIDQGKRFYVRRGRMRRYRYDYEHKVLHHFRPQGEYVANHGSPDQFEPMPP